MMKNKMTVEEFLEAGHKFVVGDKISSMLDEVNYLLIGDSEYGVSVERANSNMSSPSKRYVTSAKALDKPKRTNVTYEKVSFNKLSDAFLEHEKAPLHIHNCGYHKANGMAIYETVTNNGVHGLYRKVESEITPMQAAKDACEEFVRDNGNEISSSDELECFTLQGEGILAGAYDDAFIEMCRAIVDAYDGK